ncbi:hypothetical protein [Natronoarchaeum rubrum]|uniref:hypothetical protein n=1 Tax=Natronoarchaeum rubrum TaxID=755311 RepID=UPI0021115E84|nr:hypothetical protein [Natronoarchaeum rubrum]
MKRTALARRNRIECDECGEEIGGGDRLPRIVRWGFWDREAQNFDGRSRLEYYCDACWSEEFERDAAAHYEVTNGQRLWDILEAADGDLVADLRPIFVGGRPWIRVVDGELQGMKSTRSRKQAGDDLVIEFGTEEADVDREWFEEVFGAEEELPEGDMPTIALLKPADETPFAEYEELPEDQQSLDEVGR